MADRGVVRIAEDAHGVFTGNGWTYGGSPSATPEYVPTVADLTAKILEMARVLDTDPETDSVLSGRIMVTRDAFGSEGGYSVFLELGDI